MPAKLFSQIFSQDEIKQIIDYYATQPVMAQDEWSINKGLEYFIPGSFIEKLCGPKITAVLGPHEFATGAYKECIKPYPLHVDTHVAHDELKTVTNFSDRKIHDRALLIPLVQGDFFRTVIFDCVSSENDFDDDIVNWIGQPNHLQIEDFSHCVRDFNRHIQYLPVDLDYKWSLGDMIMWNRDQLHISTDFTRSTQTKRFLIFFVA
jgi:hypothetical protein